MKVVDFWSASRGRARKVGEVRLDGGRLRAKPADSLAMQSVLATPVRAMDGRPASAESDPEGFLLALPATYRGAYFSASAVRDLLASEPIRDDTHHAR